jgi:hypothetical protein
VRWLTRSLLIALTLNAVFVAAMFGLMFAVPLWPGLVPAFWVCNLFDPGNQPYRAACEGWHSTAAWVGGILANLLVDWVVIFSVGALFGKKSAGASK